MDYYLCFTLGQSGSAICENSPYMSWLASLLSIIRRFNLLPSIWWIWRNIGYLFVWVDKQRSFHSEHAVKRWFDNEGFAGRLAPTEANTASEWQPPVPRLTPNMPQFSHISLWTKVLYSCASINSESQTTAQVTERHQHRRCAGVSQKDCFNGPFFLARVILSVLLMCVCGCQTREITPRLDVWLSPGFQSLSACFPRPLLSHRKNSWICSLIVRKEMKASTSFLLSDLQRLPPAWSY